MRYRWGILGAGAIAKEMAQALTHLQGEIYAVASRTRESAERLAAQYPVQTVYDRPEALFADPAVDIVYIATPHNLHAQAMRQAVKAGKHVLCEKAITVNSAELKEIRALAKQHGVIVEEAMTLYHMPLYHQLREMVGNGAIGPVKMIQVNFGSCKPYDLQNRFFSPDLAGGALLDIGVYALSFARYFLDEAPDQILTTAQYFETGVDEQSGIVLANRRGQMAVISLSMRAKQPKRGVVTGEKGYCEVSNYPRADRAVLTDTQTGAVSEITRGESYRALEYEVMDMEGRISTKADGFECFTDDVMEIMTRIREQWGMRYPFEAPM